MKQAMKLTRIWLGVICFLLIVPPAVHAGTVRVNLDISTYAMRSVTDVYLEFDDDIAFGDWIDIDNLPGLTWEVNIAWTNDFQSWHGYISDNFPGLWTGSIRIDGIGPGEFNAEFMGTSASGALYTYSSSDWDVRIGGSNQYLFIADRSLYYDEAFGSFTTSVWFSDPHLIPVPSSALLLLSALVPFIGLARRFRQ